MWYLHLLNISHLHHMNFFMKSLFGYIILIYTVLQNVPIFNIRPQRQYVLRTYLYQLSVLNITLICHIR